MILGEKIVLIGDIHIGVNKNSPDFYDLTREWFKYFLEEIEKRKINHVFVLGDWHHYRDEISVMTLDVSTEIMNMFPKNIQVHILTGNHDCYFKDTSEIHSLKMFDQWENVFIYDKTTILKSGDKKIKVIPWGCDVADAENTDYVFGHFEIQNFKMNNFTICSKGDDSSELLKGGKSIYTGHFHKYQHKDYKKGSITYVGSPFQHNFNDVGNENGFHVLDFKSGGCEFVKNSSVFPTFEYVKLSNIKNLDKDSIRGNYIKLIVDIDIKESVLEQLIIKLNALQPKNLIVDDINMKKSLDIGNISDNIGELNIQESIEEFVSKMGDIKHREETLTRINKYYEKKTK